MIKVLLQKIALGRHSITNSNFLSADADIENGHAGACVDVSLAVS